MSTPHPPRRWLPGTTAVALSVVALLVRFALDPILGEHLPYVSFFVAVALTAYLGNVPATVLAILLGYLAATWFFGAPRHTLYPHSLPDLAGTISYFVVCGTVAAMSHLISREKLRALASRAELASRQQQLEKEIAERRRAEAFLAESESRYRSLLELAPAAVLVHRDRKIVYANAACLELCGAQAPEQLLGKDVVEFVHPHDREILVQRAGLAASGARTPLREFRLRRLDGREIVAEVSGAGIQDGGQPAVQVILRDVTERIAAQQAIREDQALLRAIIETIADPIYVKDTDSRLILVNPATLAAVGKPAEQVIGHTDREFYDDPAVGEAILRHDRRVMESGTVQVVEETIQTPDGYRVVLNTKAPRRDAAGRVVGLVGTGRDITERKRAEEELRKADRRKDEFLAVLSHELRNPLAPIRNSLYVLEHTAPGGAQAQRAQAVIGRQVAHLARLVDDLLDVTRIARGKIQLQRERLDLAALVRRTVEDHRAALASSELELEVILPSGLVQVLADPTRIAQVVGNLLENARKFTPPGGRIVVSLGPEGADAVIRVRDTGEGISPDLLPQLFKPFMQGSQTLDRSRGGLGLGLALSKGLVDQHGGTMTAVSEGSGRGAELTVRLPLVIEPERPETGPRPEPVGQGRRVLVIEDNRDAAESLRDALELGGHAVVIAHDGPEGVRMAHDLVPELVLCDIGLPGMDGYAVARSLRGTAKLAGCVVVALSGYALPEDIAKASAAGFHRHLAKPPSMEKLEELLASLPPPR